MHRGLWWVTMQDVCDPVVRCAAFSCRGRSEVRPCEHCLGEFGRWGKLRDEFILEVADIRFGACTRVPRDEAANFRSPPMSSQPPSSVERMEPGCNRLRGISHIVQPGSIA